jgi:hypothetical protein
LKKPTLSEHLEKLKDPNFTSYDKLTGNDEIKSSDHSQSLKNKKNNKK